MDIIHKIRCNQYTILIFLLLFQIGCETTREGHRFSSGIYGPADPTVAGISFLQKTRHLNSRAREKEILKQVRRGNIPSFLKHLVPIKVSANLSDGYHTGTIFVMPDYLSLGNDKDWIRIPMNPITAQKVADHFGFILPTTKIVDTIYQQAQIKLAPTPLPPGKEMVHNNYFYKHHMSIEKQLESVDRSLLIAGHKKDIVLTDKILIKRRNVAIYGWHRKNGRPIQPLSLVHDDRYLDYSHGVRLVAGTMIFDGNEIPTLEILQDPRYARLLSYTGPIKVTRVRMDHATNY